LPTKTAEASLPEVKFDIGGKMFPVNKEDLAYHDFGNGFSYGSIQSRGELPFSIYGDTWLKSVYAIFDVVSWLHLICLDAVANIEVRAANALAAYNELIPPTQTQPSNWRPPPMSMQRRRSKSMSQRRPLSQINQQQRS
jgi:hypothetical protein